MGCAPRYSCTTWFPSARRGCTNEGDGSEAQPTLLERSKSHQAPSKPPQLLLDLDKPSRLGILATYSPASNPAPGPATAPTSGSNEGTALSEKHRKQCRLSVHGTESKISKVSTFTENAFAAWASLHRQHPLVQTEPSPALSQCLELATMLQHQDQVFCCCDELVGSAEFQTLLRLLKAEMQFHFTELLTSRMSAKT